MQVTHPNQEGVAQASKWLNCRLLLDDVEMQRLFQDLPSFKIYNVSEIVFCDQMCIEHNQFLSVYNEYITALKNQYIPGSHLYKPCFFSAFSSDPQALYAMSIDEKRFLLKLRAPIVQLSLHQFVFSPSTRTFHSTIHSQESITWGVQFAYPQIFSNSINHQVIEVYKNREDLNTQLFRALQKWTRAYTTPVTFIHQNQKICATFRIGKELKNSSLLQHHQLKHVGLAL